MKLQSSVPLSIRTETFNIYQINKMVKSGKASIEWHDLFIYFKKDVDEYIKRICDRYPMKPISAKETVDGKYIFYLDQSWGIYLDFLNGRLQYNGLSLYEFSDTGFFESVNVLVHIFSPSSPLNYKNI